MANEHWHRSGPVDVDNDDNSDGRNQDQVRASCVVVLSLPACGFGILGVLPTPLALHTY